MKNAHTLAFTAAYFPGPSSSICFCSMACHGGAFFSYVAVRGGAVFTAPHRTAPSRGFQD